MKLNQIKVLILESDEYYNSMFENEGANVVTIGTSSELPENVHTTIAESDLIVFTGGTDVNPVLYGEEPKPFTGIPDTFRDANEADIYAIARAFDKPMVGICRGAQFLCVMNGGKLIQHLSGHNNSHVVYDLTDQDLDLIVTSSHHQMMVPEGDFKVLLFASDQAEFKTNLDLLTSFKIDPETGNLIEPEVVLWPDTKCLGHQPHPEWTPETNQYHRYFIHTVAELLEL